jgi:hypothetical protein
MSDDADAVLSLIEDPRNYCWRIAWTFDGEEGAILGECGGYTDADLAKAKTDDWDHIAATVAASKTAGVERDERGYYWESRKDAQAALRACKASVKDKSSKPWPDWAVKAKAAGWKPPKNWKP